MKSNSHISFKLLGIVFLFLTVVFNSAFAATKTFTGTTSFSVAASWGGTLPVAGDNLIINGTCTYDNNPANNLAYGTLTINAGKTLNWVASGTNTLNVTNVSSAGATGTIDMTNGGTLKINGTWTSANLTFMPGTGTVEILSTLTLPAAYTTYNNLTITGSVTLGVATSFTGNFVNNGTFTNGGFGVTFSGASSNTVTGTAATTAFAAITVNKGASYANVIDVQCVITMTSGGLTLTNGTFKLSSASTITPFTADISTAPYLIPSTAGLWCNGGTISASANNWSVDGLLRVSSGTVTIGNAANGILGPKPNSLIWVEGGNLNVAGRMSNPGFTWTYNMTGGTTTLCTVGSTTASRAAFYMDQSGSSFTMSGGTIVIQNSAGSAGQNLGYYNVGSGGSGFTGGTLQMGNGSTPAATTMGITSTNAIYNLTVNSSNVTAQLQTSALTVSNNVTLTAGTLDPNALNLSVGGSWTNNATYTTSTGGVTFNGTANQTISGSNSTTFYNLTLNNTGAAGSNVITLSKVTTVSNTLTLTKGILATTATNLLTLTNSSSAATSAGSASSFVQGPMRWNGLNGAGPFVFPTGAGTSQWARVAVSAITSATDFTCQYFNTAYSNVSSAYLATSPTPTLTTVSHVEYWDVARTSGTGNGKVTLYWENASTSYINSCASNGNLKVAHYRNSKWVNADSSGVFTVTGTCSGASAGTIISDVMNSFSPFTFGSGSSGVNPLPIELLSFDAVFNGTTTDISWQTASEINNNYFTVERSTDGINFTTLSTLPSKAVNGNSTSVLSYTLNDPNTVPGVYYFRLKQTDFDFKYTYSNVVAVTVTQNVDFTFDLAPNPNDGNSTAGFITSPYSGMVTLKIYDMAR